MRWTRRSTIHEPTVQVMVATVSASPPNTMDSWRTDVTVNET